MQLTLLTAITMVAFAANSVLCRMALGGEIIDAASFTAIRLTSGALMLTLLLLIQTKFKTNPLGNICRAGSWSAAGWLCVYATGFSFAYVSINTATGALILFGAVQLTMMTASLIAGERPAKRVWTGYAMAVAGLLFLLSPGADAPSLSGALLMSGAGVAWGMYSLLGRGSSNALSQTAGNFLLTLPMSALMLLFSVHRLHGNVDGIMLAIASGALASGLGYALWYHVVSRVSGTMAASVQLSVPVLAAAGGVLLMQEPLSARLIITSMMILGGIALVMKKQPARG
ncbi:MAG: DMT family transporter [Mariprofundus sp.]|nr:DMT family transporter [Mariprofundus sp.]